MNIKIFSVNKIIIKNPTEELEIKINAFCNEYIKKAGRFNKIHKIRSIQFFTDSNWIYSAITYD